MLIRYPPHNNGNKAHIKNTKAIQMVKFEKQLFNQKNIFGMTLLHAHAQYIYIVNAKYQKA